MNARTAQHRIVRAGRLARAFTLIEMLVCVGAVALIAVGLGKLFSATGKTVTVGKRISYLNDVATTLERQIRADLAAATRDGPMVIRHKYITRNGAGIPLSPDDRNPTPPIRRADELVIFENGQFTSKREPQFPGRAPMGSAARVYIGHGMRRASYGELHLDDDPANNPAAWPPGLGQSNPDGTDGPNQYASSWILLRHVTVLARPQATQTLAAAPVNTASLTVPTYISQAWADTPVQIGLQPAAVSAFRFDPLHADRPDRLGYGYGTWIGTATTPTPEHIRLSGLKFARSGDNYLDKYPSFASGLVDVAAFDLPMIRTRILSAPDPLPFDGTSTSHTTTIGLTREVPATAVISTIYNSPTFQTNNPLHMSKMLMAGLLPGNDPWIYTGNQVAQPANPAGGQGPRGEQRMICAATPPNFTGSLSSANPGQAFDLNQPYRQQDQAMLSASNLVVGCSGFAVDWSFGDVMPKYAGNGAYTGSAPSRVGALIWHGIVPPNPDTTTNYPTFYRGDFKNSTFGAGDLGSDTYSEQWIRTDRSPNSHRLKSAAIHWPADLDTRTQALPVDWPVYSFFGYIDPTYNSRLGNGLDPTKDPETLECPWPKLLRFTITLTDPVDPNIEQTYQFIVEVPAATHGQ